MRQANFIKQFFILFAITSYCYANSNTGGRTLAFSVEELLLLLLMVWVPVAIIVAIIFLIISPKLRTQVISYLNIYTAYYTVVIIVAGYILLEFSRVSLPSLSIATLVLASVNQKMKNNTTKILAFLAVCISSVFITQEILHKPTLTDIISGIVASIGAIIFVISLQPTELLKKYLNRRNIEEENSTSAFL